MTTKTISREEGARPRKAVVLAAGLGERLRPLTDAIPKPLMPLAAGDTLLSRALRWLEAAGASEIAVNLHWQPGPLRDYLAKWGGPAKITLSYEPIILGTGGALRPLEGFIGDEPFWLVNGDIAFDLDPSPLADAFARRNPVAAAWLTARRGPRTVETNPDGTIASFRSARPGSPGTATFCGVQIVSPRIFRYFPGSDFFPVIDAYSNAMAAGESVVGIRTRSGYWNDAGTPPRLAEVRRHFAAPGGKKRRAVFPGVPPPPRYPFTLDGESATFSAFDWPDPALAPALVAMGWPLTSASVEPLGGKRGSDRSFLRIHGPRGATAVYARHGGQRHENDRYAGHAALLADAGVPVPAVLADLPEARALVMEDVGDTSLESLAERSPSKALAAYRALIDAVAAMHARGAELALRRGTGLEPPLDMAVMRWEHGLFEEHLLKGRLGLDGIPRKARDELEHVAAGLAKAPMALIHRDLQSSNVFILRDGSIRLIDFQGMRLGPAAYDLASMLCDLYVDILDEAAQQGLLARYAQASGGACGDVAGLFPLAAVQRITQALGAFARLSALGIPRFARYINPASRTLGKFARSLGLDAIVGLAAQIGERFPPEN